MRRFAGRVGPLVGLVVAAGCGGEDAADGVVLEQRGDTVIVRTVDPEAAGATFRLVEELRIGALSGADEEMFGRIFHVESDRKGGVYVFDAQVPALRHYDEFGRFTRTVGRKGSGPGEYGDMALGLAVLDDGRVFLRDPGNARLNIYDAAGEPAGEWRVSSGLYTGQAMVVDTAEHVWLKILTGEIRPGAAWPIGLLHLDATGAVVDTLMPPRLPGEPEGHDGTFLPSKVWAMGPLGDLVVGVNAIRGGYYSFETRRPDGTVVRVDKAHDPVRVHPEEAAQIAAMQAWERRNSREPVTYGDEPALPDVKPAYRWFDFADDGTIWVRLYTPAEEDESAEPIHRPGTAEPMPPNRWIEPAVYDLFEPHGRYIGQVRLPARTRPGAVDGERVWAVQRGDMDEEYLVRYRLVETGGG